jgi:ribosomal protein S18 acetylase RimI-like enzyme
VDGGLLELIERYYDEVPRLSARVEDAGPFALFVRVGKGWPFYARPRLAASAFTTEDVRRVRARQRDLGVPEAIEWVDEVTPGLAGAAIGAGLAVARHPLMVLGERVEGPPARVRMLDADDPDLPAVDAAVSASFKDTDEVGDPGPLAHLRPRLLDGSFRLAGAFDGSGAAVGGGSHSPRGVVTEVTGVGVIPRARRRGLGAAVTAALVADAVARGATTVFLSAGSPAVASIYARLGFETVATACIAEPAEGA